MAYHHCCRSHLDNEGGAAAAELADGCGLAEVQVCPVQRAGGKWARFSPQTQGVKEPNLRLADLIKVMGESISHTPLTGEGVLHNKLKGFYITKARSLWAAHTELTFSLSPNLFLIFSPENFLHFTHFYGEIFCRFPVPIT